MSKFLKLPVHALQRGDVTAATGETIMHVSSGVRTPRGKTDVVLAKDGRTRTAVWNRHTIINIRRDADVQ